MDSEGNLGNFSKNLLIEILIKTRIVENIQIGVDYTLEEISSFTCFLKELCDISAWSYEEMPDIDPSIVEHEIKIFDNVRLV